jgi:hypothetical protein
VDFSDTGFFDEAPAFKATWISGLTHPLWTGEFYPAGAGVLWRFSQQGIITGFLGA